MQAIARRNVRSLRTIVLVPSVPALALAAALVLAAPAAAARTITLDPGEGFRVAETGIVCTFGGRKGTSGGLACRVAAGGRPVRGSYYFGLSQAELAVSRFGVAEGEPERIFDRRQPRSRTTPKLRRHAFSARIVADLGAGGRVRVAGSDVECRVAEGAAFEGWLGVSCRIAPHGRGLAGSLAPSLDENGIVVRKLGPRARIVFRREHRS